MAPVPSWPSTRIPSTAFSPVPTGLSYVNFRGSVPTYTSADGKVTFNEHDIWAKRMKKPEYLSP
jgi:hypothetical protein